METVRKVSTTIHKFVAPIALIVLALTSITGFVFMVFERILKLPPAQRKWLMEVHQVRIASDMTRVPFTLFNCVILVTMAFSGLLMMKNPVWKRNFWRFPETFRSWHEKMASFMFIWLSIVAISGAMYRLLRTGFLVDKKYTSWLLYLHCGHVSPLFQIIYVSYLFLACMVLLISGIVLYWRVVKRWFKRDAFKHQKLIEEDEENNEVEGKNNVEKLQIQKL